MRSILRVFGAVALCAAAVAAQQWRPAGGSRQANISGMAVIAADGGKVSVLVVHDNKKKDQPHAGIVTIDGIAAPKYTQLQWLGDDTPLDIEAVTALPERTGEYMLFTAAGRVYDAKLDVAAATISLIKAFDVPSKPADPDFEAFTVQKVDGQTVAVWADRGLDAKPAQLFYAKIDLATDTFSMTGSTFLKTPYPTQNVRYVSDAKIDSTGAVFITSASDPGNDGPFSSAFYFAGVITAGADGKLSMHETPQMTRLRRFDYHKVEAFDLVPGKDGGTIFGTDDENLGAAIFLDN